MANKNKIFSIILLFFLLTIPSADAFAFSINAVDENNDDPIEIYSQPSGKAVAIDGTHYFDSFQKYAANAYKKAPLTGGELKSRNRININGKFRFDAPGDVINFFTQNRSTNQQETLPAKCARVGKFCYIYVASNVNVSDYYLDRLAAEFDNNIYPNDTENFGSEWKPGIDNDAHITLLLMDIKDGMEQTNAFVAGYFFAGDEYSKAQYPCSNEREMIYLDVVQGAFNDENNFKRFCRTISHEFQHAIHWHHDANEATWLNEAMAEYSAFVNNYGHPGQIKSFFKMPDTSLVAWRSDRGLQNYGAIYMFAYYLVKTVVSISARNDAKIMREFTKALVANPEHGIAGVLSTLKKFGINKNFNDLYLDWLTANAVNNQNVSKRFGYGAGFPTLLPLKRNVHGDFPVPFQNGTIDAYGGLYIVCSVDPEYLKLAANGADVRISGVKNSGYVFRIAAGRVNEQGGNQLIGRLLKIKFDGTYSGDDFIIGPDNKYSFTVPGFPSEYKTLIFTFGVVASEQLSISKPTYNYQYDFVPISSNVRYAMSALKSLYNDPALSAPSKNALLNEISAQITSAVSTEEGYKDAKEFIASSDATEKSSYLKILGDLTDKNSYKNLQSQSAHETKPDGINALIEELKK